MHRPGAPQTAVVRAPRVGSPAGTWDSSGSASCGSSWYFAEELNKKMQYRLIHKVQYRLFQKVQYRLFQKVRYQLFKKVRHHRVMVQYQMIKASYCTMVQWHMTMHHLKDIAFSAWPRSNRGMQALPSSCVGIHIMRIVFCNGWKHPTKTGNRPVQTIAISALCCDICIMVGIVENQHVQNDYWMNRGGGVQQINWIWYVIFCLLEVAELNRGVLMRFDSFQNQLICLPDTGKKALRITNFLCFVLHLSFGTAPFFLVLRLWSVFKIAKSM